jgi:hypothetical protein
MAHRAKGTAHVMRQRLIDAKRSLISLKESLIDLAHCPKERQELGTGKENSLRHFKTRSVSDTFPCSRFGLV